MTILGYTSASVQKLAASAIPFANAPSGTMAANGAITLGTALPSATSYANCYLNLAAGAIVAAGAAGWYFCQMTSATVGTVFNNTYVGPGVPTIPSSPTPFVTTGPGAYTGVTSAVTGPQIVIPAGTQGPNGALRVTDDWSIANSGSGKTLVTSYSGTNVTSIALTTSNGYSSITTLQNRGVQNAQVGRQFGLTTGGVGIETGTNKFPAVNFALAQTFQQIATMVSATDFIVMEAFLIEVIPG